MSIEPGSDEGAAGLTEEPDAGVGIAKLVGSGGTSMRLITADASEAFARRLRRPDMGRTVDRRGVAGTVMHAPDAPCLRWSHEKSVNRGLEPSIRVVNDVVDTAVYRAGSGRKLVCAHTDAEGG